MKKKVVAAMVVAFVTVFLIGSVVLAQLRMQDRQEALAFQITNNLSRVLSFVSDEVSQEEKAQNVLSQDTQRAMGALEDELALYSHFNPRSQATVVWNDLLYYVNRMAQETEPEQNMSEVSRQKVGECLGLLESYMRAVLYTEDGEALPSTAEGLQTGIDQACQMMDTPEYEQLHFDMIEVIHGN